jgi:hypothetical protein
LDFGLMFEGVRTMSEDIRRQKMTDKLVRISWSTPSQDAVLALVQVAKAHFDNEQVRSSCIDLFRVSRDMVIQIKPLAVQLDY